MTAAPATDPDTLARGVTGTVHQWALWAFNTRVRPVGGSRADLDDVVAAGWLGVAVALRKFDPARGVKFNTFATWWVRSHVAKEAARLARALAFAAPVSAYEELTEAEGPLAALVPDHRPPPGHADSLLKLVNRPPTRRQRLVLALRYCHGLASAEIAPLLGVTRQTVDTAERRALAACRETLTREAVA